MEKIESNVIKSQFGDTKLTYHQWLIGRWVGKTFSRILLKSSESSKTLVDACVNHEVAKLPDIGTMYSNEDFDKFLTPISELFVKVGKVGELTEEQVDDIVRYTITKYNPPVREIK